jgi:hypothetical protein
MLETYHRLLPRGILFGSTCTPVVAVAGQKLPRSSPLGSSHQPASRACRVPPPGEQPQKRRMEGEPGPEAKRQGGPHMHMQPHYPTRPPPGYAPMGYGPPPMGFPAGPGMFGPRPGMRPPFSAAPPPGECRYRHKVVP